MAKIEPFFLTTLGSCAQCDLCCNLLCDSEREWNRNGCKLLSANFRICEGRVIRSE